ncbi:MAG: hypothetical protein K8S16_18770 [Bacteroidales bacterium]|nr:hypothetical protein [Bacteroidales bacterium]
MLTLSSDGFAQFDYKGHFGMTLGPVVPVDDFASKSLDKKNAGAAKTGYHIGLFTNMRITDIIGFSGMIIHNSAGMDTDPFKELLMQADPSLSYDVSANSYQLNSIMGGLCLVIPQDRLAFNLKGMIGMSIAVLPEVATSVSNGNRVVSLQTKTSVFTLAGGMTVTYNINNTVALVFDAVYFFAEPEFNAVRIDSYYNGILTDYTFTDIKQKFSLVSLGAGIAYTF